MKKGTSFFYILFAILGITFSSCKLEIEDEELYDKPGVETSNGFVMLVIPKMSSDTKYINVYRRDERKDDVINIGILFHPQALNDDGKNYFFTDKLVKKGHTYSYRVRYNIDGDYRFSAWTKKITVKNTFTAYDEGDTLTYQTSNADIYYEKTDNTIKFRGTITNPGFADFTSDHFKPMLIIENKKTTQAFEISADLLTNHEALPLIGMLPSNFMDTDITIKGIVAQKTIYDNGATTLSQSQNNKIQTIIWTEPTTLDVRGAGSSKKINIKSQSGSDGLDYSRKAK